MTPEEAANKYVNNELIANPLMDSRAVCKHYFLAGVKWARENPQWISVHDWIPDEDKPVLVYGKVLNDHPRVLGVRRRYQGDQEWKYSWEAEDEYIYTQDEVTHWQPLPPAPKEEM